MIDHNFTPAPMSASNFAINAFTARPAARSSCSVGSRMTRPLFDVHGAKACAAGASKAHRGGVRAHQKGVVFRLVHPSTFALRQRGTQRGISFDLPMEAPMVQLEFPLLVRMNAPSVAHPYYVNRCKSYREAVRTCWAMRRVHKMTQRQLAAEAGLRPQLISDYLHSDDAPTRRDLPGELIAAFENVTGNTLVSQWVAHQSQLTVLEEMTAARASA